MATLLNLSTNALRSPKLLALETTDSAQYTAQQEVAEALLGLTDAFVARLRTDQLVRAANAVVLQLNLQLEQGINTFVVASESSQNQGESVTFRDVAIHPQAESMLATLRLELPVGDNVVEAFRNIAPVRSVRNAGGGGAVSHVFNPKGVL